MNNPPEYPMRLAGARQKFPALTDRGHYFTGVVTHGPMKRS